MSRRGRHLALALLVTIFTPLASALADATAPIPLTDEELDSYRGGYSPAPNVDFQFGAVMKTFEDGQLALETNINVNQNGVTTIQQTPGQGVTAGTEVGNSVLAGAAGGPFSTPGGTTLIQTVSNGQLTNIILNTASNHSFNQQTNVTLTLPPNFSDVQTQILRNLTGLRLSMEVGAGTVRALGH